MVLRDMFPQLELLKPWLLVSQIWGSKYGNQYDFSQWFSVRGNEKYYMEFLMNLDPRHRRKDGGFNVKMEFSYDAGNPAGSIGQITHTAMPHVPKYEAWWRLHALLAALQKLRSNSLIMQRLQEAILSGSSSVAARPSSSIRRIRYTHANTCGKLETLSAG